jgi:hypothetical protein
MEFSFSIISTANESMQFEIALKILKHILFFNFPFYLQSVPVHSANVVKSCTKACGRVLTSTLLYLIGSEPSCDLGSET